ncbi:hypothetical protein [Candidatus Pristimantibacillus sp. PTI5]|uniref:hypothetical protein n=1 Tax=Candidatus Pristimantibacillus sp. PTI5 TaxID=3400422 RepID=UPI003B024FFB
MPGQEYEASAFTYNFQGSSSVFLEFWDINQNLILFSNASNNTTNQWKQLGLNLAAPPDAKFVSLRVYSGLGNIGTSYFDDAEIQILAQDPNVMLRNGGMETVMDGLPRYWSTLFDATSSTSTERKRSGERSVKIMDSKNNGGIGLRSARIPVTAGL